jgi:hypothetical protein
VWVLPACNSERANVTAVRHRLAVGDIAGNSALRRFSAWAAAVAFVFNAHWNGWELGLGIGYSYRRTTRLSPDKSIITGQFCESHP